MKQNTKHSLGLPALLVLCTLGAVSVPATSQAIDSNNIFSLGVEGFYDRYREPDYGVHEDAGYGSITGNFTHDIGNAFVGIDGRVSYGRDSYSSQDGTISDVPQWEYDFRLRGGDSFNGMGGTFSPYLGLGLRYFEDEGKGTFTTLGYYGYDRRITQLYLPVGVTYSYLTAGNWTLAPNIEIDPLLWGNVNSRLQNDGGPNENNTQHGGFGIRGEFMVGRDEGGYAWQFGPFFRYWDIPDSDFNSDGFEPHNERLQVGGKLRFLW
jgi:hypothetical protein